MLSLKFRKKHGMTNEKWTTREKISQYKGLLRLHDRAKNLHAINGEKLKRKQSKALKELKHDVLSYHQIVNDVVVGDKRQIRVVLQGERDFRVSLQDAEPWKAWQAVFQDYNLKRKQLDKLLYSKKRKEKELCELQEQWAFMNDELVHVEEDNREVTPRQQKQQTLVARYQSTLAKRHAANSIRQTYQEILDLLKKDAMYFDGVLGALRDDQRDQCRVIYHTTLMGQLAAENLDDIRKKYSLMTGDVWKNMREREHDLEEVRKRAEDVWAYAKSLVRIESDTHLLSKEEDPSEKIERELQQQIEELHNVFGVIQKPLLVLSHEELLKRLEDQIHQTERLNKMYKYVSKEKDEVLQKKNHAELILTQLEYSVIPTTAKYKSEKKSFKEKMEVEKRRELESIQLSQKKGDLITEIRMALQNLASLLICCKAKAPTIQKGQNKGAMLAQQETAQELAAAQQQTCEEPIESNVIKLLGLVSRKANVLLTMTNFDVDDNMRSHIIGVYQKYLDNYYANYYHGGEEEDEIGMAFDPESVEVGVITRAQIKARSKRIIYEQSKKDQ
ncbi:hypothetical protein TKK_0009281 [Trichogramma kaykai]